MRDKQLMRADRNRKKEKKKREAAVGRERWVEPVVPLFRTPIFSGSKQSGSWSRAAAALLIREQYYT